MTVKRSRYHVQKTYVIICATCGEDITRPLGGDDVPTRAAAEAYITQHEEDFHEENPREEGS